jgi:hypothetical protein
MDSLDISNNHFGDSDFSALTQCKKLKQLVLNGVPVSDKQMRSLGKISSLKRVYFQGARFSDVGLKQLYNLKQLKLVTMLDCPNITKAGLKELSKNVPKKCQLVSALTASSLPGIEDVESYFDIGN